MEPTLHCAAGPGCLQLQPDKVLVNKLIYQFRSVHRGDIIIFRAPGPPSPAGRSISLIKRVVAVGRDKIEEKDGQIFLNDHPLHEPYVRRDYRDQHSFQPLRVPRGAYFVLGDNRKRSRDSRDFGVVPSSAIVGKVIAVLSPLSQLRLL